MIGARDMAFPRLNAFGFWMLLFGGLFLNSSFFFGGAPERRLVRLRAADGSRLQPRPEHGLLGRRPDAARHLLDRRLDQRHRHDAEDALPRHALQ